MKNIRTETIEMMETLKTQFDSEKGGTDESKVIVDNYVKLHDAYLRNLKAEDDIFNNDVDRQKIIAETKRINNDLEPEENLKMWQRVSPDTYVTCGTLLGGTLIAILFEKSGSIFNLRTMDFLKKIKIG